MNKPKSIQDALLIFMKISFTQILISIMFSTLLKANYTNGQEILDKKVTLELYRQEIKDVLREVETRIGVHFTYRPQLLAEEDKISVNFKNERLEDILKSILPTSLIFEVIDNQIIIKAMGNERGLLNKEAIETEFGATPTIMITGTVQDENDVPLPGVNVIERGTTNGSSTDKDGKFILSVADGNSILSISFIGYASQEIAVGSRTNFEVKLLPDIKSLGEVIVVGYGTTEKKEFAGAVASIDSKEIEKLPTLSVNSALQGQASGVFVFSNSGSPGGGISVRVRGQTSINAGNDPLYVVDGVPVTAGNAVNSPTAFLGGQEQNALAGINPQDIERIEVLKDAASTSIYGSRGANGVVLITTKRGKSGNGQVTVSGWTGISEAVNTFKKLGSQEWVDVQNESRVNAGLAPLTNEQWGWDGKTDTDWLSQVFRKGKTSQYNLSASGGDEKTKYYLSGSYRKEDGTMIGNSYDRATGRLNVDTKVSDLFKIGSSISVSAETNNRIPNDNNIYGIYTGALSGKPINKVKDELGNYIDGPLAVDRNNPVREAERIRFKFKTLKLIGNVNTNFHLAEWLDFKTDFSYDYNTSTGDVMVPSNTAYGRSANGIGAFTTKSIGTYVIEPTLRFNRSINDVHSFNAVMGSTVQETNSLESTIIGRDYPNTNLTYTTSASNRGGSHTKSGNSYSSIFARASYSFNKKYLASATVRRDGSSKFGPANRYATFYAFSAGWNFTEENFFKKFDWLNAGKLRASYGIVGNSNIGDYTWQGYWAANSVYSGTPGLNQTQLENPNLKWETSATTDVGLELGFFQNRLNVSVGYYTKTTSDLLHIQTLPSTTGFTSYSANIGTIENSGTEIDISSTLLENNNFKWSIKSNISFLANNVVSVVDQYAPDGRQTVITSGFGSAIVKGRPLNAFIGLKYLGVDPGTGKPIYADFNNDGVIDVLDQTVIGNGTPKYMGGFTNSISYKGLSLDVFFQFIGGNDVLNYTNQRLNLFNSPDSPESALGLSADFSRRWRKPGDITDVPKAEYDNLLTNFVSSRYISDGSYLRLKNISLAYDFNSSVLSKVKLRTARIYFTGSNLLTFTRYDGADPEVSSFANTSTAQGTDYNTLPQTKMYTVGIQVGF